MDVIVALASVVLGILLGALGQSARVIVGIKKQFDLASQSGVNSSFDDWFNIRLLVLSLIIGGIAGGLASLMMLGKDVNLELLLGLVAAGYAGTDFIEGFMKTKTPQITDLSEKTRDTIVQQIHENDSQVTATTTDQNLKENEIKQALYSLGKISNQDRADLARMDDEANQIQKRRAQRDAMRREWIIKGISVPASEAYKLYLIDGYTDDHDIQRANQLNQERADIIKKYPNI
ncbi:MAG: hypothetical protein ABSG49_11375 [Methanoregula sp.]|jgi:hypothetical protein|uniref:hypothetical protein n=1 Tax=Methanoregula sp. TaxID=2052170 RepID=UPI003C1BFA80